MGNVDVYRSSPVSAQDVIEFGCDHVVIATGARWTRQILDTNEYPGSEIEGDAVYTPDDILAGAEPEGPVVIYDFDHYYMGSCLAELLRQQGTEVTLVTPANAVSAWTLMNNELADIRNRMNKLGVSTVTEHYVTGLRDGAVQLVSNYPESDGRSIDCGSLVVVGVRARRDSLYQELSSDADRIADAGIISLQSIGDCRAPGAIAHAVYSGHECARTIDADGTIEPFAWERARL
jgi:dimethylamine/trimethylamine dehydrogenase